MHARLPFAVLLATLVTAGCNLFGGEAAEAVAARREADGKAIGGACRHAGRAIEDCYLLNRRADKAAIYAGWREMNDYMRENKIEALPPQLSTDTVAQVVEAEPRKASRSAEKSGDKPVEKQPAADKPRTKDSGSVVPEKTRKSEG